MSSWNIAAVRLEVGLQLLDVSPQRRRLRGRAAALGPALDADEAQRDSPRSPASRSISGRNESLDEAIEVGLAIFARLQIRGVHRPEMRQAEALVELLHERLRAGAGTANISRAGPSLTAGSIQSRASGAS